MLEQLFGSRTRVKLLRLFVTNPETDYYVRELTRKIKERINSIRRELDNLEAMGLLEFHQQGQKKFYRVRTDFTLYPELRALMVKSQIIFEHDLTSSIKRIGQLSYLAMTGIFTNVSEAQTDLLIVGKVNRQKLKRLVGKFHRDFDKKIRYTVMSKQEFEYRNDVTDRFLYSVLENRKIVVIDKIFNK